MRRFYAFGVLAATAVAAVLGLKVTEANAHCTFEACDFTKEILIVRSCAHDICGGSAKLLCGYCVPA